MDINQGSVQNLSEPDERCWVNWKLEERDGRLTKVPYTPHGTGASSTSSASWSTYAEAAQAADKFDGIGIVFTGSLLGVDLDHCISIDKSVSAEISSFIDKAHTYTEVSPSGSGLHLYLRLTEPLQLERNRSGHYECYTSGRFFTVTGTPWTTSYPLRTVTPAEAVELLRELGYPWKKQEETYTVPATGTSLADNEILERMFAARNGSKIRALYEGDTSEYGNDESRADAALCSHLAFWTGGDPARIETLWLASPLGARTKTQKRADYRTRTINNAIASTRETYNGSNASQGIQNEGGFGSEAVLISLADIEPQPVNWLWKDRIARGKVTLICGDPGLSKSLMTVTLAAIISRGSCWPVDNVNAPLGDTVLISAEDDPADTIRPRLDAAGADPSRVHVLRSIQKTSFDGKKTQRMFSLQDDIEVLADVLETLPAPRLVIIDPISAYLGSKVDSHKNSDIRALLAPLADAAARLKVAIIAVTHLSKDGKDKDPIHRTMGSLAFTAAARASFIVVRDKQVPDRRLVLPIKNNNAQDITGLAYSVVTADNGSPVIVWEKEAVMVPRDQILSPSSEDDRTDTDYAEMVLEIELGKGPKSAKAVAKAAKDAGVGDKALRRARAKLGVVVRKVSFSGGWEWELPGHQDAEDVQDAPSKRPTVEQDITSPGIDEDTNLEDYREYD